MPADFNVTAYRDRPPWRLVGRGGRDGRDRGGRRRHLAASSAATAPTASSRSWPTARRRFTTPYSEIAAAVGMDPLARRHGPRRRARRARRGGRRRPADGLRRPHGGPARCRRPRSSPRTRSPALPPPRAPGPVAPERFALLQALLAFLLARCGDGPSASVESAELQQRFRLTPPGAPGEPRPPEPRQLRRRLLRRLLRDRERPHPRRQGALRRHLPPPGPALAARGQGAPAGARRGRAAGRRRGPHVAGDGAREGRGVVRPLPARRHADAAGDRRRGAGRHDPERGRARAAGWSTSPTSRARPTSSRPARSSPTCCAATIAAGTSRPTIAAATAGGRSRSSYIKEARLSDGSLRAPPRDGRSRPLAGRRRGRSPGSGSRPSGRAGSSRAGPARGRPRTAPRWPT